MKRKLSVVNGPEVLTTSSGRTFNRCPQEFYYRYELGIVPLGETAAPLRVGTTWHGGMDDWWLTEPNERLSVAISRMEATHDTRYPFELAMLRAMLRGYEARWGEHELNPIAAEEEFRVPIKHPITGHIAKDFVLCGAMDKLARVDRGQEVFVDHKTTGDSIGQYRLRLEIDPQVSNYTYALQTLGRDLHDCLFDVAAKPSIRPLKATPEAERKYTKPTKKDPESRLYANQRELDETPQEYELRCMERIAEAPEMFYARVSVPRMADTIKNAQRDLIELVAAIKMARKRGYWRRHTDSCVRWSRECGYLGACSGRARIDDPALFQQLDHVHVELSREICAPDDPDVLKTHETQPANDTTEIAS